MIRHPYSILFHGKFFTSALIGCALEDGLISSIDDKGVKYLPEWQGNGLEDVSIRHLLQMTSGIRFNESYVNPFGDTAKYYYGRHLRR
jgi:CubicO group peptidase (beta-lactamase class C family)